MDRLSGRSAGASAEERADRKTAQPPDPRGVAPHTSLRAERGAVAARSLDPSARASVCNVRGDVVAMNRMGHALFPGLEPGASFQHWLFLDPSARASVRRKHVS